MTRRQVVLLGAEGMQTIGIAGPIEILDAATQVLDGTGGYDVRIATLDGLPVRASAGMRIAADLALGQVRSRGVDTLIVGGGMRSPRGSADPRFPAAIERIARGARRTCSVCTGAFHLAEAGLLDGRTATTHWAFCAELARRHPAVTVAPDRIFVRDGPVTTSAGATAGMDLALALVEEDHGPDVARAVARWTVMFLQRPGGQSQFSARLGVAADVDPSLRTVLDEVVADPAGDHRLSALARRAALSERHFRRRFADQTGTTPARFVERVRVEAARELLERTATPVDEVAARCGFGSPETLRRACLRVIGVGPAGYRARFRTTADGAAPH
ncbi:GlxA family transcriptional regulator [Patulibacter minatonensis]|uniref:GlxA family transcriptional regulator n=1 Tax=Patulibacter minatonensis TaxID=298163 RepID=UPI0004793923|nr:GlxA family transcriptional regulator [Patulibacter minatonensis]